MHTSPHHEPRPGPHLSIVSPHRPIEAPRGTVLEQAMRSGLWIAGVIRSIAAWVGGVVAFEALDDTPLPDEAFDWSAVECEDREFVAQVLALADTYCDRWLDVEYRTIARRTLARAAAGDPRVFRRSRRADKCAAGLVWLVLRINTQVHPRTRRRNADLWWAFGVPSCTDRANALRRAAGLCPELDRDEHTPLSDDWKVGDPALLHSRTRRWLIETRTRLTEEATAALAKQAEQRPMRYRGDGQVDVRAAPAKPLLAAKGLTEAGRAMVMVGFGESDDDAEVFALTVPQAHDLVAMLGRALAMPLPRRASNR